MRVTVFNPGAPTEKTKMAKRKRSKSRKAHKKNPRKRAKRASTVIRRKRRHTRKNPAPRRRHRKAHAVSKRRHRARKSNPGKRYRRRRGHRRNPMNPYVAGALAVALSLGVGAVEGILPAFIIPKDFALQQKVRMGAGAVGTIVGIALVKRHPIVGLAIAAPSFAVLASGALNEWINKLFSSATTSKATTQSGLVQRINAIYASNLNGFSQQGAPPRLNAVYGSNLNAVYGSNLGALPTTPPWTQATPYG
jgi:hypothetical protein